MSTPAAFVSLKPGTSTGASRTRTMSGELAEVLMEEIAAQQSETVRTIVPWFLNEMPQSYFKQIRDELQRRHIKAIAALHDLGVKSDLSMQIVTKSEDATEVTCINTHTAPGALKENLVNLPTFADYNMTKVQVFSSHYREFCINVFTFTPLNEFRQASIEQAEHILSFVDEVRMGKHVTNNTIPQFSSIFEAPALKEYVIKCTPEYISNSSPRRFMIQRELYEKVRGSDNSAVHFENYLGAETMWYMGPSSESSAWITIAAGNVMPAVLLRSASSMLSARGIDISRVHLDQILDDENSIPADGDKPRSPGYVTMVRLMITPNPSVPSSANPDFGPDFIPTLTKDLKRAKWLDDTTMELGLVTCPQMGVDKAEVITALSCMLHGPLNKMVKGSFPSSKAIVNEITSHPLLVSHAMSIADIFLDRFRPGRSEAEQKQTEELIESRADQLRKQLHNVPNNAARIALEKMLDAVFLTLRTNFYFEDRWALSLRIDPIAMFTPDEIENNKPVPYGVFFSHGRRFNGFHNRFRDIARGGLRIVTPSDAEARSLESTKHFDEVWGLSYAQQQKNKDIPEGGAKAVIQIDTPSIPKEYWDFTKRKSVKSFVDSILDLIVRDENFYRNVVDYFPDTKAYNKDELIYLGPDEQVITADIDWITKRAGERGYPLPAAFMSSKKDAGFNHKQYGVTSEGVVTFLYVALLRRLNIDPYKQPFTVKITGGPDGDVAGNLIKILFREYGTNCRVVGIADGFGVAEDPNGLDKDELLRLVAEGRPISFFNTQKLSPAGIMMKVVPGDSEANNRRNTMACRVKADVFVPGGGRPNAINADNWADFLDPVTREPSSSLVVEGANLFFSPDARAALHEAGVSIVKDSSANKCGVVTSSCEIVTSMLLTKQEFLDNKSDLIADVLKILRRIAKAEAEMLFHLYENYPGSLPHFSERISNAINRVTDAITVELQDYSPGDDLFEELFPIIRSNLPEKLAVMAWDRARTHLPLQYQKNAIASGLASHLVYTEGIHLVESQPDELLAKRAFAYYRAEQVMKNLVSSLESGCPSPEDMASAIKFLKVGGARTIFELHE